MSTDSTKIDEPFKVDEAGTVNVPPPQPPTEKVVLQLCSYLDFVGWFLCVYVFTKIEIMYVSFGCF